MESKLRDPIRSEDFGIPPEHSQAARNFAEFLLAKEQEPVAEVVWSKDTDYEYKFKMLVELACKEGVPVKLYAGPFESDGLYWHNTETDSTAESHAQTTAPVLSADEFKALARFCDTCEDGEGYDVPKKMMKQLARIGVVNHVNSGVYELTEFGQYVIDTVQQPQLSPVQEPRSALFRYLDQQVANDMAGFYAAFGLEAARK